MFIPALLIFSAGCNSEQTEYAHSRIDSAGIVMQDMIPEKVAREWPEGFSLDTIYYYDSLENIVVHILTPVSGITQLDSSVKRQIRNQLDTFLTYLRILLKDEVTHRLMPGSFECSVDEIYQDTSVISYLFRIYYYNGIGVHGMNEYYSYNFDKNTNSKIEFQDYFRIQTHSDTVFLLEKIRTSVGASCLWLDSLCAYDFNLQDSIITFDFDNYEISSYSSGLLQGPLTRNEIAHLIADKYR